jgi:hypothetical protein
LRCYRLALGFGATGQHDFGKYIRQLGAFVCHDAAYTAGADYHYFRHGFLL